MSGGGQIPAGVLPQQLIASIIQAGISLPQPAANPEALRHLTAFLSHDSDNRLTASDREGKRRLIFKFWSLAAGTSIVLALISLPIIALAREDDSFTVIFLDRHMPYIVAILTALLGGAGIGRMLMR
jgi:uncharacterized integral membrane protein